MLTRERGVQVWEAGIYAWDNKAGRVNKCTFCFAPQMVSRSLTSACLRCCNACSKSSKAALIWARASALRSCSCWLMPPTKAIAADSCGSLGRETTHTRVA